MSGLVFTKVGVRYCIAHEGVANEDDSKCDFSYNEPGRCVFRQLGWRKKASAHGRPT